MVQPEASGMKSITPYLVCVCLLLAACSKTSTQPGFVTAEGEYGIKYATIGSDSVMSDPETGAVEELNYRPWWLYIQGTGIGEEEQASLSLALTLPEECWSKREGYTLKKGLGKLAVLNVGDIVTPLTAKEPTELAAAKFEILGVKGPDDLGKYLLSGSLELETVSGDKVTGELRILAKLSEPTFVKKLDGVVEPMIIHGQKLYSEPTD